MDFTYTQLIPKLILYRTPTSKLCFSVSLSIKLKRDDDYYNPIFS